MVSESGKVIHQEPNIPKVSSWISDEEAERQIPIKLFSWKQTYDKALKMMDVLNWLLYSENQAV